MSGVEAKFLLFLYFVVTFRSWVVSYRRALFVVVLVCVRTHFFAVALLPSAVVPLGSDAFTRDSKRIMASGCALNIKIGECARPNTYKPAKPVPVPKTHSQAWQIKSQVPEPTWATDNAIADEATSVAQAWLSHPANKMQLPSLQKMHDLDGDGLTNRAEFEALLKAAGSGSNANLLFDQMDADGDGVLTEAEIKALGQDRDGRARNRGGP